MKAMMHIVAALLLTLHALVNGQSSPPPPVTQQDLQQVAASLKMYVDQLPQMQRILGYDTDKDGNAVPTTLTIGMYQTKWKFHRDLPDTTVFVYGKSLANATFPGPTIEARQGVPLNVTWENHLPTSHILPWDNTVPVANTSYGGIPTVVHLHGSVHPPQSDGSALAWFTADFNETGPKWTHATYTYPNVQPAGNLWYHDHALGYTRANLLAGLLGTYIIRKPSLDARLNLPQGSFDLQLVIADRTFNADGSLYMNDTGIDPPTHPQWQPEFFGEAITVNGKAWPYLNVVRRRYRFRILNASNARYFRLSFSNGLNFVVVGSDASYLSQPITASTLLMAPAEILDVVVDFAKSTVNQTEMLNDAPYPYPNGAVPGTYTNRVMKFFINPGNVDSSTIPTTIVNYTTVDMSNVTATRCITLYEAVNADGHSTRLYLNGLRFEDTATETPKSGTTELWNVTNLTGDNHPFHIHLGMMQTVKVQQLVDLDNFTSCMIKNNDTTVCNLAGHATGTVLDIPPVDMTWKNTIKIEPGCVTSVVIKFRLVDTDSAYPFDPTVDPGYVYHCHILDHEDNAMIRPLLLT